MISYIGGKSRISSFIIPFIPKDTETYVESFGGMYWVFFKMKLSDYPNLKKIVYNDFNPLNVNLINCVRNYKEFYDIIKDYKSQDYKLFYSFQKELFDPNFKLNLKKPDYHTASKYAYLLTQVFSGTNCEKAKFIDLKGKYKSKFDSFKNKLQIPGWQEHFDKITITENLDFEDIFKKYDSEKTYFYCDPPYYLTEKYYANHDFGLESHKRLSKCLKSLKGKFGLSYYYFKDLEKWFPKNKYTWEYKEFYKPSMATKGKAQNKAIELLIMNY